MRSAIFDLSPKGLLNLQPLGLQNAPSPQLRRHSREQSYLLLSAKPEAYGLTQEGHGSIPF